MLNDEEIKKLADNAINVAAGTNRHPYSVLVNTIRIFQIEQTIEKEIMDKCKIIIKSRAEELPWSL